jgi:predicted DNA-binding protein with PD1-like motif
MEGTTLMPEIQWKIDLGNVITVVGLLVGGAIAWGSMSNKLDEYQKSMVSMQTEIVSMHQKLDEVRYAQVKTETELRMRDEQDRRQRGH